MCVPDNTVCVCVTTCMKDLFDAMDVNGNGQIGKEQFLEVFNIALREQMDVLMQGTLIDYLLNVSKSVFLGCLRHRVELDRWVSFCRYSRTARRAEERRKGTWSILCLSCAVYNECCLLDAVCCVL